MKNVDTRTVANEAASSRSLPQRNARPAPIRTQVPTGSMPVKTLPSTLRPAKGGSGINATIVTLYLLAQCYTIPILCPPIGWALWPAVADIVAFAAIVRWGCGTALNITRHGATLYSRAYITLVLCCISTAVIGYALPQLFTSNGPDTKALSFGFFQIYRVLQIVGLLYCASRINWTESELATCRRFTFFALTTTSLAVWLTYTKVVTASFYAPQIPANPDAAGLWALYHIVSGPWGVTGYNHAYTALQILLLGSLYLSLSGGKMTSWGLVIVLFCMATIFISRSRAGFAAACIYLVLVMAQKPALSMMLACLMTMAGMALLDRLDDQNNDFTRTLERQSTIMSAEDSSNLAGRDKIWDNWLDYMLEHPLCIVVGSGFGATAGHSAHNQFLHLIIEVGAIGLLIYLVYLGRVIYDLWKLEPGVRPVLCATLAILPTLLTQESLYPVTALGHFPCLFLVSSVVCTGTSTVKKSRTGRRPHEHSPHL